MIKKDSVAMPDCEKKRSKFSNKLLIRTKRV